MIFMYSLQVDRAHRLFVIRKRAHAVCVFQRIPLAIGWDVKYVKSTITLLFIHFWNLDIESNALRVQSFNSISKRSSKGIRIYLQFQDLSFFSSSIGNAREHFILALNPTYMLTMRTLLANEFIWFYVFHIAMHLFVNHRQPLNNGTLFVAQTSTKRLSVLDLHKGKYFQ